MSDFIFDKATCTHPNMGVGTTAKCCDLKYEIVTSSGSLISSSIAIISDQSVSPLSL